MALFDFLKRKKAAEKAKNLYSESSIQTGRRAEGANMPVKKTENILIKKEKKIEKPVEKKSVKGFSYDIVKEPHISEKATILAEGNQYVFKINADSNKTEIKKSIEGVYGVNVLSVNIIKIPNKKRKIGKIQGFKSGHTKAVVKITKGQKIEIL